MTKWAKEVLCAKVHRCLQGISLRLTSLQWPQVPEITQVKNYANDTCRNEALFTRAKSLKIHVSRGGHTGKPIEMRAFLGVCGQHASPRNRSGKYRLWTAWTAVDRGLSTRNYLKSQGFWPSMVSILLYAYVKKKILQIPLGFLFLEKREKIKKLGKEGERENFVGEKVRPRKESTALGKSPIFGNLRVDRPLSTAVHAVHRRYFPERLRGLACCPQTPKKALISTYIVATTLLT